MQQVTTTALTVEEYADNVLMRGGRANFESKETRDAVAKCLEQRGKRVSKSHIRGQNLHPEYVLDYVGTYHTGFGNSDYQTYWSVLYGIAAR